MATQPKRQGYHEKCYTWLTVTISALVLVTSSAGIFIKDTYAKELTSWALQAVGQDMANIASVPLLLFSGYHANNRNNNANKVLGKGLMVWIGVLLFLIYVFAIYAFDVHYNSLFLLYVSILGLSFYTLLGRLTSLNFQSIQVSLSEKNNKTTKAVAVFLILIAGLFCFQWLSEDIPAALTSKTPFSIKETGLPTNPVHVLDLAFFLPGIFLTGIALYRMKILGYIFAAPFLVFSALTGVGILFSNALIRMNGISVSFVPDVIVGLVVIVSIILSWSFLRGKSLVLA